MFEIAIAPHERVLQSTVRGFFSVPDVLEYAEAMERAHRRYFRFAPHYRLVIDASETKIQTQDVLQAFAAHISSFPPAETVGVVIGRSLNRFQMLRLLDRPHVQMTDSLADAQRWATGKVIPGSEFRPFAQKGGNIALQVAAPAAA